MNIYSRMIDGFTDRGLFIVPNIVERFSASIGGHVLNLCNLDHKLFLDASRIPKNYRIHIIFSSFSGYGKSTNMRLVLRDTYGLLFNNNKFMPIDIHSHFSTASWFGTIDKNSDKEMEEKDGVFAQYKRGMIGADDFQAIEVLFNGRGCAQDEEALLTALDTDEAVKTLAMGKMRIQGVGMTFWAGLRPVKLNLKSGFARRFSYQNYFPTRKEAELLRKISRGQGTEPNFELEEENNTPFMLDVLQDTYDKIKEIGHVKINCKALFKWLDQFELSHFDENVYKNLAIGFSVACGDYPKVVMTSELEELLMNEMENREVLRTDPDRMMIYKILKDEKKDKDGKHFIKKTQLIRFLTKYLQFQEDDAENMVMREKRAGRVVFEGTITKRNEQKVTLNWEPDYLSELRRE